MEDTDILKELLGCFYKDSQGNLEWSFVEGVSLEDVIEDEQIIKRLHELHYTSEEKI